MTTIDLVRPGSAGPTGQPAGEAWAETIEAVLAHARNAPEALGRTLEADPLFAQGHALKGLLLLVLARVELVAAAQASLIAAREAARLRPAPRPAADYIEALAVWLAGETAQAADILEGAHAREPRDILSFKLVQAIRFMIGDVAGMLRCGQAGFSAFAEPSQESGYVRGCLAFALEEDGQMPEAERIGRQAVELAPRDAWGRHAVAHVFEMSGRARDGVEWLGRGETWRHCSNFGFHLHWHMALFQLELGEIDAVLALYDTAIRAARTDDFRDLANAASLLQRLELEGVDVGSRWEELAAIAEGRVADRRLVFADLHYMLALLGAGREEAAGTIAGHLARDARARGGHDARVAGETGALTARGVMAFRRGDYAEAAALLMAGAPRRAAAGGSNAQRDVFEQMCLESLVRAGETGEAERLLRRRLAARGGRNRFASERLGRIAAGRNSAARLGAMLVSASTAATHH